jgi:hypothetical protein
MDSHVMCAVLRTYTYLTTGTLCDIQNSLFAVGNPLGPNVYVICAGRVAKRKEGNC